MDDSEPQLQQLVQYIQSPLKREVSWRAWEAQACAWSRMHTVPKSSHITGPNIAPFPDHQADRYSPCYAVLCVDLHPYAQVNELKDEVKHAKRQYATPCLSKIYSCLCCIHVSLLLCIV